MKKLRYKFWTKQYWYTEDSGTIDFIKIFLWGFSMSFVLVFAKIFGMDIGWVTAFVPLMIFGGISVICIIGVILVLNDLEM